MFERIGRELEAMLGGERRETAPEGGEAVSTAPRSPPSLQEQRDELDRLLRAELERQGIVVGGADVARVVAAAAGKGIEWAG
jgi:hypothetical protein